MQEVKTRNPDYGIIPEHKFQIAKGLILGESIEGGGAPKGNTIGVFDTFNGGHKTDQVVGGQFVRHTCRNELSHRGYDVNGVGVNVFYVPQT